MSDKKEPLIEFIDSLFNLINSDEFEILPDYSKGMAMDYVTRVIGGAGGYISKEKGRLQEIEKGKQYILFADDTIDLDDVFNLNEYGASIGVVRVGQ